tara:strand:+ start:934 stop:1170 length:237 start_codon:yes stop_codon:yes gene_type:complete
MICLSIILDAGVVVVVIWIIEDIWMVIALCVVAIHVVVFYMILSMVVGDVVRVRVLVRWLLDGSMMVGKFVFCVGIEG